MFTYAEFNLALYYKNTRSSPGISGIDYEVIKRLSEQYKLIVIYIFNEMYYIISSYPAQSKKTYVHLIKKRWNKNVCPVSLT